MKKYRFLLVLACAAAIVLLFPAGASAQDAPLPQIGKALGVSLGRGAEIVQYQDSHGGFHGDGLAYAEVALDGEALQSLQKELQNRAQWRPFPLSADAACAFYGSERMENGVLATRAPSLPEGVRIPAVQRGFWLFTDRQEGGTGSVFAQSRASCNFTAGLLDLDRGRLYMVSLDT